jgi:hypothetical protein
MSPEDAPVNSNINRDGTESVLVAAVSRPENRYVWPQPVADLVAPLLRTRGQHADGLHCLRCGPT